jgi:CRISPR-associated endonuclease/helicase Cas3
MNQPPDYFRYWGKAEKDGPGYHLLVYHCLDVAAVVAEWWASSPAIRRSFCSLSELSEEQIRAWVLFFAALHDYGKFDVRFQLRVKTIWQKLYAATGSYGNLPSEFNCKQYYHGESGLFWLMQDHGNVLGLNSQDSDVGLSFLDDPDESVSENRQVWKTWLEAVTGHHGQIKRAEYNPVFPLRFKKSKEDRVGKIQPVSFHGVLKIIDADAMVELVKTGVGPAKAFGCGLVSLSRRI